MLETANIQTVAFKREEHSPVEMGIMLDDLSIMTLTGERLQLPYWEDVPHKVDGSIVLHFDEEYQALHIMIKPGESLFTKGRPLCH